MNRMNHLQQTLEKNIKDNYLPHEVEFILLDYNSKDGLEEWVQQNMQQYIDAGVLVYYKTYAPEYYLRSHSRNMSFRLANAELLCNLDADNFLGKGFAAFMIEEFSTHNHIFYTSNCSCNDTIGRVCVRVEDFMSVRGYNEAIIGYGCEDMDFFNRLNAKGLNQMHFHDPEFYHFVCHSDRDRVSDEYMAKNVTKTYITYVNPYTSGFLLLYKDFTMEQYTLIDTHHLTTFAEFSSDGDCIWDERYGIALQNNVLKGKWSEDNDMLCIQENDIQYIVSKETSTIQLKDRTFYEVQDTELAIKIFALLSEAISYYETSQQMKDHSVINPDGFGKGTVYKNFDLSKKIILS